MRRCIFLALAVLLSFTTKLSAQVLNYKSTFVSFTSKTDNGEWAEWTDWVEDDTHFEIDNDEDFITINDNNIVSVYLILSSEESEDEEGDFLTVYECIDEDFGDVTITFAERLSLEDQRLEIYVDIEEESTAYIVELQAE